MYPSDQTGTVHIRRSDQRDAIKFDIDNLTPEYLQDAFQLDNLPTFLKTESSQKIVGISPSKVLPNEHYVIRGPESKKAKKSQSRSGKFLTHALHSNTTYGSFLHLKSRINSSFVKFSN